MVIVGSCWSTGSRSTSAVTEKGCSSRLDFSPYSASSFKYRKGLLESLEFATADEEASECVVCLLGFEDGEEVRKLDTCKHSFHAPCIDMWMYSHSNCPICRTPVDRRAGLDFASYNSSSVLTQVSINAP
ncbi:Zinc finger, RING-type [Corchorus capsularis]|uniref:RING-type E3 ubiquitin transferase n=1 Tax=Corchorus capsularis TaxID=210143 RepID=A0A1R3HK51_COCAP|nr:Zinc finger, RING-type [Corchorus capsularis]